MRWSAVFLILIFAGIAQAQNPTCGLANSTTRIVAPNYAAAADPNFSGTFFAPPNVVGATFSDNIGGTPCTIKQISYGATQYGRGMRHEYANMSAINANDTLMELQDFTSTWSIVDLQGNIIVPEGNVPWSGGLGGRWDASDPLTIYYVGPSTAKIFKSVIPSNFASCKPSCTVTNTLLHDFSATYIAGATGFQFGGGEGDIQISQPNLVLLCGIRVGGTGVGSCEASAGTVDVFLYNVSTDAVSGTVTLNSSTLATQGTSTGQPVTTLFDSAQITSDGNIVIDWDNTLPSVCVSGPCYGGIDMYSGGTWTRGLWVGSSHTKQIPFGGHNYLVLADTGPYVCANQGVARVDTNTGASTCILNLIPWLSSIHIGGSEDGSGWVSVDHVDFETPGAATYPLATNWNLNVQANGTPSTAGYWGTFTGEEVLLKVDGSAFYRLTWNRSRPNASSYWKSPRACISRDAHYWVYDSDYGQGVNTPDTDYSDVFLIATGIGAGGSGAMASSGGAKFVGGVKVQ